MWRLWLLRALMVGWAAAAVVAFVGIVVFAKDVTSREDRLRQELRDLQRDHSELQGWVIGELQPWLEQRSEEVSEVLEELDEPGGSPAPSAEPLPELPTPSLEPSPVPSVGPSPSSPPSPSPSIVSPSPSPTCILGDLVCLGGEAIPDPP